MKSSLKTITQANLAKRLFAILLDGLFFVFSVALLSFSVLTPIANKAFKYNELQQKGNYYKSFSKLYVITEGEEENKRVVEIKEVDKIDSEKYIDIVPLYEYKTDDLEFYKERLKYYYLNYSTNKNLDLPESYPIPTMEGCFYSPLYNKEIAITDGSKIIPETYYTEEWFNQKFGSLSTQFEWRDASKTAASELFNSSYFDEINDSIGKIQLFIRIIPLVLCFGIYYVAIPLIYKNGETLGKKFLGIGFVNKDGYQVKKRQIIFRQLLLFVWVGVFMFAFSLELITSIATTMLGVAVYAIATAIPKSNRSPIDFAAYTLAIDVKKSVWFLDAKDEEKSETELAQKMEKYGKYEPDKKHLIQVGTEIVDEQVKKEFEAEKNKKVKKSKN